MDIFIPPQITWEPFTMRILYQTLLNYEQCYWDLFLPVSMAETRSGNMCENNTYPLDYLHSYFHIWFESDLENVWLFEYRGISKDNCHQTMLLHWCIQCHVQIDVSIQYIVQAVHLSILYDLKTKITNLIFLSEFVVEKVLYCVCSTFFASYSSYRLYVSSKEQEFPLTVWTILFLSFEERHQEYPPRHTRS